MHKIGLFSSDYYYIVGEMRKNGKTILYQSDYSFLPLARMFGHSFKQAHCHHDHTDGTVDCPDCGKKASAFIQEAACYLDSHENKVIMDKEGLFPEKPQSMYLEVRYHFDVWGNAREGYEVNNSCVFGYIKTMGPNADRWPSNNQILGALKRMELVKRSARMDSVSWDTAYVDAVGIEEKGGKPFAFISETDPKHVGSTDKIVRVFPRE